MESEEIERSGSENFWAKEETTILISMLKQFRCLYDPSHIHYSNRIKKAEAYKYLLDELKDIKPNITVLAIKTKIRTLRNQWTRERAKILDPRTNGKGFEEGYKPTLWCYDQLKVLMQGSERDRRISSSTFTKKTNESEPVEMGASETSTVNSERSPKQSAEQQTGFITVAKFAQEFNEKPSTACSEEDKEQEFCKFLFSEMKKIKIEENFEDLKWEILEHVRKKIQKDKADRGKIPTACVCTA